MNNRTLHRVWLGPNPQPELDGQTAAISSSWWNPVWTEETAHLLHLRPHHWEHATFAGSSNVIRLHALKVYGGIYCDWDIHLLRPIDELLQYPAWVCRQPDGVLCNAAFGAVPDHPWIRAMLDNYGDQRIQDAAYGCHILEKYITPDVHIFPSEYWYPFGFDQPRCEPGPNAFAYHDWEGSWLDNKHSQ